MLKALLRHKNPHWFICVCVCGCVCVCVRIYVRLLCRYLAKIFHGAIFVIRHTHIHIQQIWAAWRVFSTYLLRSLHQNIVVVQKRIDVTSCVWQNMCVCLFNRRLSNLFCLHPFLCVCVCVVSYLFLAYLYISVFIYPTFTNVYFAPLSLAYRLLYARRNLERECQIVTSCRHTHAYTRTHIHTHNIIIYLLH
jgi:hypothetical protein